MWFDKPIRGFVGWEVKLEKAFVNACTLFYEMRHVSSCDIWGDFIHAKGLVDIG